MAVYTGLVESPARQQPGGQRSGRLSVRGVGADAIDGSARRATRLQATSARQIGKPSTGPGDPGGRHHRGLQCVRTSLAGPAHQAFRLAPSLVVSARYSRHGGVGGNCMTISTTASRSAKDTAAESLRPSPTPITPPSRHPGRRDTVWSGGGRRSQAGLLSAHRRRTRQLSDHGAPPRRRANPICRAPTSCCALAAGQRPDQFHHLRIGNYRAATQVAGERADDATPAFDKRRS